jgi:pilus assembly protein CpaE
MRIGRPNSPAGKTQVAVLTDDAGFAEQVRTTFGASEQITLKMITGTLATSAESFDLEGATVAVVDLDPGNADEMAALEHLMALVGTWPPVVVVTQTFDAAAARTLVQMRVADFLVKPVSSVELVRTCARVAKGQSTTEATEAQIYTFLPAVGGAGVTTLAIQTAMLLLNSGQRGKRASILARSSRARIGSTGSCLKSCSRIIPPASP